MCGVYILQTALDFKVAYRAIYLQWERPWTSNTHGYENNNQQQNIQMQ